MKKTMLFVLMTLAFGAVQAAGESKQSPAEAKATAAAPAPAGNENINPMTGKELSIERLDRTLEIKKRQSAIAQEDFKIKSVEAEMELLPSKMQAEKSKFKGDMAKAGPAPIAAGAGAEAALKGAKSSKKVPPPAPVVSMPTGPSIAGVMKQDGKYYAIVENGSQSAVVKAGEIGLGMKIDSVSEDTVTANGRRYTKLNSIARIANIDRQPPAGQANAAPNGVGVAVAQAGTMPVGTPAPIFGSAPMMR